MANQELSDYIAQARAAGQDDGQIRAALLSAGWDEGALAPFFAPLTAAVARETALPGFRDLFNEGWSILKQRFFSFFFISALPLVVALVGFLLIFGQAYMNSLAATLQGAAQEADFAAIFTGLAGPLTEMSLLFLAVGIIAIVSQGAIFYLAADPGSKRLGTAIVSVFKNIVPITWLCSLYGVLVGLGSLLLIPGLMMAVNYSLALPIFVSEGESGWSAFRKSANYLKEQWWPVGSRFLILSLIITLLLSIPFLNFVILLLLPAIYSIFSLVIYRHLKAIHA